MKIDRMQIHHFRNLLDVDIHFHPEVNWIIGENGSGKTSLLESIYCLGSGRSFRTSNYHQLVNHAANGLNLFAQVHDERDVPVKIGIQIQEGKKRIRVNNADVKVASQLAEHLAVQVISPDQSRLIEEGPRYRRSFMDWGLFHVEHSFKSDWRRLTKILKQRNAQLKVARDYDDLRHWDKEYVEVSETIQQARRHYIQTLQGFIERYTHQLEHFLVPAFELYAGWPKGKDLAECLHDHFSLDRKRGITQHGPHKSDLRIKVHHTLFKDVASRGQIKLLATLLKLSQLDHLTEMGQKKAVLMIDDIAAEFDPENQQRVFDWARATGAQIFVTCTDDAIRRHVEHHGDFKMFHVEHGQFQEVL